MALGLVYEWRPDPLDPSSGSVAQVARELPNLGPQARGLQGTYVRVKNLGIVNFPDPSTGRLEPMPIGNAVPDDHGNFCFDPCRGGARIDKVELAARGSWRRYVEAAHFGEVNTYFHLNRIAAYVDGLMGDLEVTSLPRVAAAVCAHNSAVDLDGLRDGVRRLGRWVPFEGGHYRLPALRYDVREWSPIEPTGEIHLGPGRHLAHEGALVQAAGRSYRSNASHNAGTIYHEYGHHIMRHTADPRGNRLRQAQRQKNVKTPIDEGTSDYWAAALLETPHIWAWHRGLRSSLAHPRSLVSPKTMADFDPRPGADPHPNGTIWAAALWDLRSYLTSEDSGGARLADLIVLKALLLLGEQQALAKPLRVCASPWAFSEGLRALLSAAEILLASRHSNAIRDIFSCRGIVSWKS